MIYLNEINDENTFDLKQTKAFLKAIKGHKYECFFKLIMTYEISRLELVNIKWEDIDFAKLPNSFVIKTIHDSGSYVIVKDKTKLNIKDTRRTCYQQTPAGTQTIQRQ